MSDPGDPLGGIVLSSPLDPGVAHAVRVLRAGGVETYESCEGGPGHAFPEPTVCFHGDRDEGWRALGVALRARLPVFSLRRVWIVRDGEPVGPEWELTLFSVRPHEP